MNTNTNAHKFPWINTGAKTVLFLLKNRIKAPRVVPAPSTGDAATDDTTRREFERVKEQLNADYQDQRTALTDLEPLIYELAEQVQGWMSEKEHRLAEREERMMSMMLMSGRTPMHGIPALHGVPGTLSLPATSTVGNPLPVASHHPPGNDQGGAQPSPYEGQLLRGDGTQPVYKIEGGRKRWIINPDAFNRNGFSWNNVRVVPPQLVRGQRVGRAVAQPRREVPGRKPLPSA